VANVKRLFTFECVLVPLGDVTQYDKFFQRRLQLFSPANVISSKRARKHELVSLKVYAYLGCYILKQFSNFVATVDNGGPTLKQVLQIKNCPYLCQT